MSQAAAADSLVSGGAALKGADATAAAAVKRALATSDYLSAVTPAGASDVNPDSQDVTLTLVFLARVDAGSTSSDAGNIAAANIAKFTSGGNASRAMLSSFLTAVARAENVPVSSLSFTISTPTTVVLSRPRSYYIMSLYDYATSLLSTGAIAGIAVGAFVAIICASAACLILRGKKRASKTSAEVVPLPPSVVVVEEAPPRGNTATGQTPMQSRPKGTPSRTPSRTLSHDMDADDDYESPRDGAEDDAVYSNGDATTRGSASPWRDVEQHRQDGRSRASGAGSGLELADDELSAALPRTHRDHGRSARGSDSNSRLGSTMSIAKRREREARLLEREARLVEREESRARRRQIRREARIVAERAAVAATAAAKATSRRILAQSRRLRPAPESEEDLGYDDDEYTNAEEEEGEEDEEEAGEEEEQEQEEQDSRDAREEEEERELLVAAALAASSRSSKLKSAARSLSPRAGLGSPEAAPRGSKTGPAPRSSAPGPVFKDGQGPRPPREPAPFKGVAQRAAVPLSTAGARALGESKLRRVMPVPPLGPRPARLSAAPGRNPAAK
jgi:hypothetical protein